MDPDVSFAQTNSRSVQMEKEKTETTQSSGSKFFYVDDFFYWLGCKFVTCDKPKSPETHQES